MEVKVNKEACVGCGLCASIAASIFAIGDDGLAEVVAEVTVDNEGEANEAKDNCPAGAIEAK